MTKHHLLDKIIITDKSIILNTIITITTGTQCNGFPNELSIIWAIVLI